MAAALCRAGITDFICKCVCVYVCVCACMQWRIQQFSDGGMGSPTPEFGPKTYYLARCLPKTARK